MRHTHDKSMFHTQNERKSTAIIKRQKYNKVQNENGCLVQKHPIIFADVTETPCVPIVESSLSFSSMDSMNRMK